MTKLNEDYSNKIIDYYNDVRLDIVSHISRVPKRVLDIGCGCGSTLKYLKKVYPGVETVGVEGYADAANIAAENCDRVCVFDLNDEALDGLDLGKFDVILCCDVLEHLIEPGRVLSKLKSYLKDDGEIIVSLPNVRFLGVLLPLVVLGRWTYVDTGVLDRTHLRFFTRSSGKELIQKSGYLVNKVSAGTDGKFSYSNMAKFLTLGMAAGFTSRQFVYRAQIA